MHIIGNYTYDPDRLIFYRTKIDENKREKIFSTIHSNDEYDTILCLLNKYDTDNVPIDTNLISQIGISLSNNCNLRCNYCSDSATSGNKYNLTQDDIIAFVTYAMKRWKIAKLINKNSDMLTIWISGNGEPTYDWDFFVNVIQSIEDKSEKNSIPVNLKLTTNGILNTQQQKFIVEHFDTIMVSYDGLPEIQNKNRTSTFYSRTSDIVENTIDYFLRKDKFVRIRTTLWYDDFIHLKSMAEYIFTKFNGNFEWNILPVMPNGRALNYILSKNHSFKEYDFLLHYLDLSEYVTKNFPMAKLTTPFFPNSLISHYCGGLSFMYGCHWLLPDKRIVTCFESNECIPVIGNIDNGIVNYSKTCKDELLLYYKYKYQECRECIAYRFCKGGCPIKHMLNSKISNDSYNYECETIKKYFYHLFEKITSGEISFGWRAVPINLDWLEKGDVLTLEKINAGSNYEN